MPSLDAFNSDVFNMMSLTEAIDKLPYVPAFLGSKNLFTRKGIQTTTAMFDEREGVLSLIPTAARGSRPTVAARGDRRARSFVVPHLPLTSSILADDVQNVRAFGQETALQTMSAAVNDELESMKQSFEATFEYHRAGAIKGVILDADGTSVIYNLFTEYGLTQHEVVFNLSLSTFDVKSAATEVLRHIRDALGATMYMGVDALCGDDFFDELTSHAKVAAAFDRWQDGQFLRDQQFESGFPFGGITWYNYRGSIGSIDFFNTDEAYFYPTGVPRLFIEVNAPADYAETVNTIGKPYYAKQERMAFDKGVLIEAQSNPLFICTRPQCLVKGVTSASSSSVSGSA